MFFLNCLPWHCPWAQGSNSLLIDVGMNDFIQVFDVNIGLGSDIPILDRRESNIQFMEYGQAITNKTERQV